MQVRTTSGHPTGGPKPDWGLHDEICGPCILSAFAFSTYNILQIELSIQLIIKGWKNVADFNFILGSFFIQIGEFFLLMSSPEKTLYKIHYILYP